MSGVDQHNADAGSDLFENERDQSVIERLERELEAIARAEQRVEEGTYGVSVESGEPIPDGRLEAIPWAERTAEEQARFDARQGPVLEQPSPSAEIDSSVNLATMPRFDTSTAESPRRHGHRERGNQGRPSGRWGESPSSHWLSRRSASLSARARQLTP